MKTTTEHTHDPFRYRRIDFPHSRENERDGKSDGHVPPVPATADFTTTTTTTTPDRVATRCCIVVLLRPGSRCWLQARDVTLTAAFAQGDRAAFWVSGFWDGDGLDFQNVR